MGVVGIAVVTVLWCHMIRGGKCGKKLMSEILTQISIFSTSNPQKVILTLLLMLMVPDPLSLPLTKTPRSLVTMPSRKLCLGGSVAPAHVPTLLLQAVTSAPQWPLIPHPHPDIGIHRANLFPWYRREALLQRHLMPIHGHTATLSKMKARAAPLE